MAQECSGWCEHIHTCTHTDTDTHNKEPQKQPAHNKRKTADENVAMTN